MKKKLQCHNNSIILISCYWDLVAYVLYLSYLN